MVWPIEKAEVEGMTLAVHKFQEHLRVLMSTRLQIVSREGWKRLNVMHFLTQIMHLWNILVLKDFFES